MKYIILHDINYVIREKYKLIIGYFLIFLYYYFWGRNIDIVSSSKYFIHYVFGDCIDIKSLGSDIIGDVFFVLNYGLPILFSIFIYNKDIDSIDNFYTRLSISRWLNIKIMSNILISLGLYLVIYLIALIFGTVDIFFFQVIVKKVFITVFFEIWIYSIMMFFKKNKLISIILLLFLCVLMLIKFDLIVIPYYYILLIFLIGWVFLNIIGHYLKFSDLKG